MVDAEVGLSLSVASTVADGVPPSGAASLTSCENAQEERLRPSMRANALAMSVRDPLRMASIPLKRNLVPRLDRNASGLDLLPADRERTQGRRIFLI